MKILNFWFFSHDFAAIERVRRREAENRVVRCFLEKTFFQVLGNIHVMILTFKPISLHDYFLIYILIICQKTQMTGTSTEPYERREVKISVIHSN